MAALVITASAVIPSAYPTSTRISNADGSPTKAYEAVTAGQVAYARTVAAEGYGLATCTGATPLCRPVGIFCSNAAAGQVVDIVASDPSLTMNAVLVIGKVYILGAAPGAIHLNSEETTGWKKTVLGIALSTTTMSLSISPVESPAMA